MSDIERKPCPFCGGLNTATPPGQAVVCCGDCDASGPYGAAHPTSDKLTVLAAYAKWNKRHAEDSLRSQVATLTRERDEAKAAGRRAAFAEIREWAEGHWLWAAWYKLELQREIDRRLAAEGKE